MTRRGLSHIRPGLDAIRRVLDRLDNPERSLGRVVLISGTNGKGSVAAFLEGILLELTPRVALYTSPHLVHVCERLRLGGRDVTSASLDKAVRRVMAAERSSYTLLTGFELATAAAFLCAAEAGVEFSVVEVGMGGRLDATNVVEPELSVLTPIGVDHVRYLGPDPVSIAREKLGITRPGKPCLSSRQEPDVAELVERHCRAQDSPLVMEGRDFEASGSPDHWSYVSHRPQFLRVIEAEVAQSQWGDGPVKATESCQGEHSADRLGTRPWQDLLYRPTSPCVHQRTSQRSTICRARRIDGVRLSLPGHYQVQNAGVAAAAAEELGVPWERIVRGLGRARCPGRFDLRTVRGRTVLFDGGHNVPAIRSLVDSFRKSFTNRPAVLYAAKEDKNAAGVLSVLSELASSFVFTTPGGMRGYDPWLLSRLCPSVPSIIEPNPACALDLLLMSDAEEPLVCCGSFYLVGYYARTEFEA